MKINFYIGDFMKININIVNFMKTNIIEGIFNKKLIKYFYII
jgi:hypothetical protein